MGPGKSFGKANWIRRAIREILGLTFWLHAFYAFGLVHLPQLALPDLSRYLFNALLAVFIFNYSFFTDNGWWSVIFDLGYMYSLPFIYVVRFSRLLTKRGIQSIRSRVIWENPQLITTRIAASPQPKVLPEPTQPQSEDKDSVLYPNLGDRFGRVFLKFAPLWALFTLTVNWKPFLIFAVGVSLLGAMIAIFGLWGLFSGKATWADRLEIRLANLIQQNINKISVWNGIGNAQEITNAINAMKLYRSMFKFVSDNSSLLSSWAFTASVVISIPFYSYVSFLFACVYFGIAKVTAINMSFPEAFIDSLFMPFAWSALPGSLTIKFIAGLQATCVAIIGYNVAFRHIGNRLDRIAQVAEKLRDPFEEEHFKSRMAAVEALLSNPAKPNTRGKRKPRKR